MYTKQLLRFAAVQIGVILAVLIAIPITGLIAVILINALVSLFCGQMHALMILAVVLTASVLAAKQLPRHSTP